MIKISRGTYIIKISRGTYIIKMWILDLKQRLSKTREFYQKIFLIFKIYFLVVPTSSTTTEHHEG